MKKDSRILLVGHDDIIEKSLFEYFQAQGYSDVYASSKIALNTTIQNSVYNFFQNVKPEYVFLGSVRSGGIEVNQKYAAEFIYQNLESQNNIIHSAYKFAAKKLLFFGSSCVYPQDCAQPIKEEYLLTAPLEPTSEPYAVAKIAGIKLCQTYKRQHGLNAIAMIPATIYGPESDTNIETAHVIGALLGKFHDAKIHNKNEVVVWGTGQPRREFLYVDDFIDACLFLMDRYEDEKFINVGCGSDVTIKELSEMIKEVTEFSGKITFDTTKPNGTMQKLLDNTSITQLGWRPKIQLLEGIKRMYAEYLKIAHSSER